MQLGDVNINEAVDDKQKERLEYFIKQKKELGDLRGDEDFEKLSELGAGNGGVVHCVKHKTTGKILIITTYTGKQSKPPFYQFMM